MSMNAFFKAFTQEEIDAMAADAMRRDSDELDEEECLIDRLIWGDEADDEGRYAFSADIESAWDILDKLLDGAGLSGEGQRIDDALSNGCVLISADEVKNQAEKLSQWTNEMVLKRLKNLDDDADIYHLEAFKEGDGGYLLEQFDKMVAFYKEAADKGLGAVFYVA